MLFLAGTTGAIWCCGVGGPSRGVVISRLDPILGAGAGTGTGAPAPTTEPLLLGILGLVSTKICFKIIPYEQNIKPTFSFLLLENGTLALDNIV